MAMTEAVSGNIANGNHDSMLQHSIMTLCSHLKKYGPQLETVFKGKRSVPVVSAGFAFVFKLGPSSHTAPPKQSVVDSDRPCSSGEYENQPLNQGLSELHSIASYSQDVKLNVGTNQLDRAFLSFRNGSRDEHLDVASRLHLLEVIELRTRNWSSCEDTNNYYKQHIVEVGDTITQTLSPRLGEN
uniref:Uncharacterized protein n=1 Tax=Timema monikensis TaxID=170555 RepID=A0A7R9HTF3_9NEOP|nr:unnamed protein product [Timema monikensis]